MALFLFSCKPASFYKDVECKESKKVKTSIYIARFMHQAPLTHTSLKLTRQTAI